MSLIVGEPSMNPFWVPQTEHTTKRKTSSYCISGATASRCKLLLILATSGKYSENLTYYVFKICFTMSGE